MAALSRGHLLEEEGNCAFPRATEQLFREKVSGEQSKRQSGEMHKEEEPAAQVGQESSERGRGDIHNQKPRLVEILLPGC